MNRGGRKATLRSAPADQPEEVVQELGEVDAISAIEGVGEAETEGREPTLADLTGLFRAHMAKTDAQEAQ